MYKYKECMVAQTQKTIIMATIAEVKTKFSGLIEKTKLNPELILTLPYDTMIEFIDKIGRCGETKLYSDLKDIAYEKYGELAIASLLLKLEK